MKKITQVRLYSGEDNKSHFEDLALETLPLKHCGSYTFPEPVNNISFVECYKSQTIDFHCSKCPQYIVVLKGEIEVTAADGEKRILKPGDVLLAEDMTGVGHKTRYIGACRMLVIMK